MQSTALLHVPSSQFDVPMSISTPHHTVLPGPDIWENNTCTHPLQMVSIVFKQSLYLCFCECPFLCANVVVCMVYNHALHPPAVFHQSNVEGSSRNTFPNFCLQSTSAYGDNMLLNRMAQKTACSDAICGRPPSHLSVQPQLEYLEAAFSFIDISQMDHCIPNDILQLMYRQKVFRITCS